MKNGLDIDKILVLQSFKTKQPKKGGRENLSLNQLLHAFASSNLYKKGGGGRTKINNVSTTLCTCICFTLSRAINCMYIVLKQNFLFHLQNKIRLFIKTYSYMYDRFVQINHYPIKSYDIIMLVLFTTHVLVMIITNNNQDINIDF